MNKQVDGIYRDRPFTPHVGINAKVGRRLEDLDDPATPERFLEEETKLANTTFPLPGISASKALGEAFKRATLAVGRFIKRLDAAGEKRVKAIRDRLAEEKGPEKHDGISL